MANKVIIGVGGRFHADKMAEALNASGADVSLFTTLPRSRFPRLPESSIHPTLLPEVVYRVARLFGKEVQGSITKMRTFGKYFAQEAGKIKNPSVLVSWSSFGVEALRERYAPVQVVVRDSAHISEQIRILKEEYTLRGIDFPDHAAVEERELEEYERADKILVLSPMARQTFIDRGVSEEKLHVIPLGADLTQFSAGEKRPAKLPLRVVYFGAFSFQKGVPYLLEAMQNVPKGLATLTCIGGVSDEMKSYPSRYPNVTYLPPMPHGMLSKELREFDVFVFPSLHDGFGMVLPQAMASGLVPVVSSMVGASGLVSHGKNGFVVPPKDAGAITDVISNLAKHPETLESCRSHLRGQFQSLSWEKYSRNIASWFDKLASDNQVSKAA